MCASQRGQCEAVEMLVSTYHADINRQDKVNNYIDVQNRADFLYLVYSTTASQLKYVYLCPLRYTVSVYSHHQ